LLRTSCRYQPFILFLFFGLFRNRSVCFGCFDIDPKHQKEPKQTEKIIYWFHETNRKTTETGQVSVCFGSNRKFILFVSRTPYFTLIPDGLPTLSVTHRYYCPITPSSRMTHGYTNIMLLSRLPNIGHWSIVWKCTSFLCVTIFIYFIFYFLIFHIKSFQKSITSCVHDYLWFEKKFENIKNILQTLILKFATFVSQSQKIY
jgi:hypothetical protein